MLAEFFGTFVLITLGLGTCALNVVGLSGSGRQSVAFGPANQGLAGDALREPEPLAAWNPMESLVL